MNDTAYLAFLFVSAATLCFARKRARAKTGGFP
jgi:hypothetical protein